MATEKLCKNIKISRKATKSYELQFTKDNVIIDITGWSVYFTVKSAKEDSDASAKIKKTITAHSQPTAGITLIELTTSDTDIDVAQYYWEVSYKDDDGNQDVITSGRLTITKPVLDTRS